MYAVSPFSSLLIFTFFFSLPSNIQSSSSYENCAKRFNCGELRDVDYPFWGGDRPLECGHPGFELNCSRHDGVATIAIKNVVYRVLEINNSTDTIKVARDDFFDGICTSKFVNTSIDHSLFEYTGGEYTNVTILYGCPPSSTAGYDLPVCHIHDVPHKNVDVVIGTEGPGACNKSVTVPVPGIEIERHKGTNFSWLSDVIREVGFKLKWKNVYWRCGECKGTGENCGYDSGLNNQTTCFCPGDERYDRAICSPRKESFSSVLLIVGIILGTFATVGIVSAVLFFGLKQRKKKLIAGSISKGLRTTSYELDKFMRNHGSLSPKQYNYSDVKRITKSFANKLGQGGYGSVYKGKLSDGRPIAAKILSESKGNGEEFLNEVASISKTSHVNVVSLLGFCYKGTKRALIYEFMSNSSLDKFIHREKASPNTNIELDRTALLKIAVGIARGLEYLHSGCNTRILHLDIKPHNILLDQDWCPKISDFGLAKLCQRKDSVISTMGARGTIGYIAPEVFSRAFGRVSYKSDVYSYGMMILEMAGVGKSAETEGVTETSEMYFPNWIYKKLEAGPDGVTGEEKDNEVTGEEKDKEMERKMILVGLWCIQTKPADRPSMAKVIEMLEGSTDLLLTPPKPFLFSPTSRSPTRTYSSSSLSSTSQIIDIQS